MVANSRFVARILTEGMWEPDSPEPERRSRPPLRGDHSKIHVIHEGTDIQRFRPLDASALRKEWGVDSNHFVFGVVGGYNLPRGKGQREFLRAAAPLSAKFDRARFVLVGRGDLAETLRRDIEQLGLAGRAQLTPWYSDMPPVIDAIDCLVHPQIGTEAFPSVVLEAMACAKPVIGTSVDGIPEQVVPGETGLLVPPEDLAALGEAMTTILQDPALGRALGRPGVIESVSTSLYLGHERGEEFGAVSETACRLSAAVRELNQKRRGLARPSAQASLNARL